LDPLAAGENGAFVRHAASADPRGQVLAHPPVSSAIAPDRPRRQTKVSSDNFKKPDASAWRLIESAAGR